jgi:hypothetical protein
MKVIAGPKYTGKTEDLIIISAEKQIPIVCPDEQWAAMISNAAFEANLIIPKPYTIEEVYVGALYGTTITDILIDGLDVILHSIFTNLNIHAITICTDDEKENI